MSVQRDRQTVLVTGGAGFIGSHTCKALAQAGYIPVTLDNLSTGNRESVRWGPLELGDISDSLRVRNVLETYRPELVLHFAASAYVGESVADPRKYYDNNVRGTLSLLDEMLRAEIRSVVFSSSCATYGIPEKLPLTEESPQNPINPYGFTKLIIERVLRDYEAAYGMKSMVLRYFNAAGADPDGEIGEQHSPETHAIPLAILAALGRGAFSVFGDDYPTADGSAVRDYVHVSDLAQAHVLAATALLARGASDVFNLGTGKGVSVLEIVAAVEKATRGRIPLQIVERRPGDPPELCASAQKAAVALGWRPLLSLDEMVGTATNWFSSGH